MRCVLLRLLLIVSLVMNGFASPWAAAMPGAAGHEAAPVAQHGDASDCHQAEAASDPDSAAHDGGCCDGPHCKCGCLATPLLQRVAAHLAPPAWAQVPASVPATRASVPRLGAPFRPPAA